MHQHVVTCEAERSTLPGSHDSRITKPRITACAPKQEESSIYIWTRPPNLRTRAASWKFPRAPGAIRSRSPALPSGLSRETELALTSSTPAECDRGKSSCTRIGVFPRRREMQPSCCSNLNKRARREPPHQQHTHTFLRFARRTRTHSALPARAEPVVAKAIAGVPVRTIYLTEHAGDLAIRPQFVMERQTGRSGLKH